MSDAREELADRLGAADIDVARDARAWRALPQDAEAVARLVRITGDVEHAPRLVPLGGGTRLAAARPDLALPGAAQDTLFIDLARIEGVVEYEPGDGTLTARAGTPWATLAEVVARGGHDLTPDVSPRSDVGAGPGSGRSTLGGVLAAGASGPDRIAHGPVRHHVLGALVATGSGTLARSGGRLVKNVTGFDVFRLHIGGRGTLGVILEASLRLMPRPEHEVSLALAGQDLSHALALAERIRRSAVQPRALTVTNVLRDGHTLAVHLAGRSRQVARDADELARELGPGVLRVEGDEARRVATELRDTRARFASSDATATRDASLALSVTSVPSSAGAVAREAVAWCGSLDRARMPHVVAWPAVAQLDLALPAPAGEAAARAGLGDFVQRLRPLGARVRLAGGALAVARALEELRESAPPDGARWEHALRAALDPRGHFCARALAAPVRAGGTP